MKTRILPVAAALLAFALVATTTPAQTTTPAKMAATSNAEQTAKPRTFEDFAKEIKKPVDWLSWGGDLRLRNEYFDNSLTLNKHGLRNEQDYFRIRERLWASFLPVTNLSVNARVAAEEREWMKPSFAKQFGYRSGLEDRYGILDQANVKWNNVFDLPLSITAGRQDIQLGDPLNWWLVLDGTPYDGSWTTFFDSIRLTYDAQDIKTKFDLIYIYQNALPDEWIPTIGESSQNHHPSSAVPGNAPYWLTEQTEQGVILYGYNKSIENTEIDGYFIYKRDQRVHIDILPIGDDADIYTIGGKVTGNPFEHWKYSAEGAYQFGNKKDPTLLHDDSGSSLSRDIDAFGVNSSLSYLFKDPLNNQASLVFECLSGDNPKTTGKDEMFDILWGRWPRWSELYIYSYPNETSGKFAQLNNIIRFGPSWSLSPIKDTTFSAMYNALFALEDTPTRAMAPTLFSNDGNFRGHYVQTVLKHQFNKRISGHLWGEFVLMGDYYTHKELMTFLRAEMTFTF
jgi:hypothetical protein